jgi:hypothetical protein
LSLKFHHFDEINEKEVRNISFDTSLF